MGRQMNWQRARRNAVPAYVPTHLERRSDRYFTAVSKPPAQKPSAPPFYLAVPYAEREAAKRLGARWDIARRRWWISSDMDRAPFAAWIEVPLAPLAISGDETPPWC